MTIDRVGSLEPVLPGKKPGQNGRVDQTSKTDSINLSSEAVEKAELFRVIELVSATPDSRMDRIEELKQKINDPSYINDTIIEATADRILDVFGF
jgi:negative regulator of flagellin synthesis FlgM